jgi:REP element-mobilizing transposase RayT
MIVEGIPGTSIEEYALAILNDTRHWMTQKYSGVLKETQAWDVWQPSFYVGSVGEFTTTQVSSFLAHRE